MSKESGKNQLLGTFLIWLVTGLLAVGIIFIAIVVSRNNAVPVTDAIETLAQQSPRKVEAPRATERVPRPPVEEKYKGRTASVPSVEKGEPGTLNGVLAGSYPRNLAFSGGRLNEGLRFPLDYTCYRTNKSPAMNWEGLPAGTKSLALLLVRYRYDEGKEPFINWGVYNIDPASARIGGNLPNEKELANGALQIRNDYRNVGYTGPCEPKGKHPYSFYLFAVDRMLPAGQEVAGAEFYDLLEGHILDYNEIKVVHYLRN